MKTIPPNKVNWRLYFDNNFSLVKHFGKNLSFLLPKSGNCKQLEVQSQIKATCLGLIEISLELILTRSKCL
jgi:hypothetical protein